MTNSQFLTDETRQNGFNPDDPSNYGLGPNDVPWVDVPDISNVPGAFDAGNDPYAAYADGVIASLQENVSGTKVIGRANFVAEVRAWRSNQKALEAAILARCDFPSDHCDGGPGCLLSVDDHDCEVMPDWAQIALSHQGDLSVPVRAAILGLFGQENVEKVFLGICAPDAHSRVKMGGYNVVDKGYDRLLWSNCAWRAPLEVAATYHGDHLVARDVAISWLYLHDGDRINSVVDLSLDALMARVEAVPPGATVGVSSRACHVISHAVDESKHAPDSKQRTPLNTLRGPRALAREDDILTREQVLATLQTPSETLIQALEAAAAPDAEWLEAEKLAAKKEGEPTWWLQVDELDQRNFLEEHAPYHVRRLPNGGVMLATHPCRYMWPLWARALDLLGIRSQTA